MVMADHERADSRITVKDLNLRKELSVFVALALALALGIAAGFWDLVILAVFAYLFQAASLGRRLEFKGRPVARILTGPSIFANGIRALPRDVGTLLIVSVGFPTSAVVLVLIQGTILAWIGLAMSIPAAIGAAVLVVLELTRRY
jgi:hypothetical protein